MKRLISIFLLFLLTGCGLSNYLSVGIRTNIPYNRGDGVVVTCPTNVSKIILKKYSRFSSGVEFTVVPGRETFIPADGAFSDQPMSLVGFVYGKKGIIGRVSQNFSFSGNSFEVRVHIWNITRWESIRSESDWFWGIIINQVSNFVC